MTDFFNPSQRSRGRNNGPGRLEIKGCFDPEDESQNNSFNAFECGCSFCLEYDPYVAFRDDGVRLDGEEGPFSYTEFYEYYGDADSARAAWANGTNVVSRFGDFVAPAAAAAAAAPAPAPAAPALTLGALWSNDTYSAMSNDTYSAMPSPLVCCDICSEHFNHPPKPKHQFTQGCQPRSHKDYNFCVECVRQWIGTALFDGRVVIRCMVPGCNCRMSHLDVKEHATVQQFAMFQELADKDYTAKYADMVAESAGMKVWVEENTQQCPSCLQLVSRSDGCNHMQCACGASFCYGCGVDTSTRHYSCRCNAYETPPTPQLHETEDQMLRRVELTAGYTAEVVTARRQRIQDAIQFQQLATHPQLLTLLELRVDAVDGCAYPRVAFVDHYGGEWGTIRWAMAGVAVETEADRTMLSEIVLQTESGLPVDNRLYRLNQRWWNPACPLW